jgi:hypothetical protein
MGGKRFELHLTSNLLNYASRRCRQQSWVARLRLQMRPQELPSF